MAERKIVTHDKPAWRERADFAVGFSIDDGKLEQLAAAHLGQNRFEVCCIPFFAYDLALGDIVETLRTARGPYMVSSVVKRSGHSTFRVWLGDSSEPARVRGEVTDFVTQIGASYEERSFNLLAIDAPAGKDQLVTDELWRRQNRGELVYETGRTSHER